MLHEFISTRRAEIIARTRTQMALRTAPRPSRRELETGVPLFLDQLVTALRGGSHPPEEDFRAIGTTAAIHGGNLLELGFTVSQVVHGYGDVCQVVTALAQDTEAAITTEEFHILNRCLDDAIAEAVTEYIRLRERAISEEETMRSGLLAHELRNALSGANLGFELIKRGTVATGGSVGAMVSRNLARIGSLIDRSLTELRVQAGVEYRENVAVAELIEEAEIDGVLAAATRNVTLTVTTVERDVAVRVDRQVVSGVIANLMQNAFKFTRADGLVALRASATSARVVIEVEDECGGLPPGKIEGLFGAFQQRGDDRSGLGVGLFISRKGVESNDGVLGVRDIPGKGCVFTIDLPRTGR